MFPQLNEMLTPGAKIHLIITQVDGQLQVISTVTTGSDQMAAGTAMLKGSADEMEEALLKVLTSKSEVVTTLQDQVAAAQMQDKKTVSKALSQPSVPKSLPAPNSDIDDGDNDGDDADEFSSAPASTATNVTSEPAFTLFG